MMLNSEVFDKSNPQNVREWDRLPKIIKYFVDSNQKMIMDKIVRKVREKYGEAGIKDLVKSSGWRSDSGNRLVGGVANSLHLYGGAVDFLKVGIFKDTPIPTCCELQTIDSGKCWHVQLRRY